MHMLAAVVSTTAVLHSTSGRQTMPAVAHRNPHLSGAPNVWCMPLPKASIGEARDIFNEALRPLLLDGLISELDKQHVPCRELVTSRGKFFAMRAGSSTNEELRSSSDLAWISVDDEPTFASFAKIFWDSGVADALRPLVDYDEGIALYSCFYVIRSRCGAPNFHTDWDDSVGTNAFTLLAPLEEYETSDFHLLYHGDAGATATPTPPLQYRYREGEAIVFASHFVHSTEPGCAVDDAPHAFLCFTFGSDKAEHWPSIVPTIGGYQSRIMKRFNGTWALTEIGEYLQADNC